MKAIGHLVVRASAGSGKTYALSTRYLSLLRAGAPPQTILATTFTRKAAGEILQRVLLRLAESAADESEARRLAADLDDPALTRSDCAGMLASVCRSLGRLSVSTLDSFFHGAARAFAPEIGLASGRTVTPIGRDDPRAVELRRQAIAAVLEGERDTRLLLDWFGRMYPGQTRARVTDALDRVVVDLHGLYQSASDPAAWSALEPPQPLDESEWNRVLARIGEHGPDMLPRTRAGTPMVNWDRALTTLLNLARSRRWEAMLGGGLTAAILAGRDQFSRAPITPEWLELLGPVLHQLRARLLGDLLSRTEATYQFLRRFDAEYARLREDRRLVLFEDLPRMLADEAWDDEAARMDLYYRLDRRVAHLLLDEFQDTSVSQWSVLRPIAQEITAHRAGLGGEGSRSFFCVGDVKQAIYGWRGGCAGLFDVLMEELHLSDRQTGRLVKSYRSSPVVLSMVDRVMGTLPDNPAMAELVEAAEGWAAIYQPHEAHHRMLRGRVELWSSAVDDQEAAAPAQDEGTEGEGEGEGEGEIQSQASGGSTGHSAWCAELVRSLSGKIGGMSIGVLTRTNAAAAEMLGRLRRAGVSASGESGASIADHPAVSAVLSALTLADHPGDDVAAFTVAAGPLGGVLELSDADDPTARSRVSARIRRSLMERGYAGTLDGWSAGMAERCEAADRLRLEQLADLARSFDREEAGLRPTAFVRKVEASAVEDAGPAAVRVMTIHKAKGLEFDAVVLPELQRRLGEVRRLAAVVERDGTAGPIRLVCCGVSGKTAVLSDRLRSAWEDHRTERAFEDLCSLYVALTRARRAVYLVTAALGSNRDGGPSKAGWADASPAAILRRGLCGDEPVFAGGALLYATGVERWWEAEGDRSDGPALGDRGVEDSPARHERMRGRLAAAMSVSLGEEVASEGDGRPTSRRSWARVTPSSLEGGGPVRVEALLPVDDREPAGALRGTVLHGWFAGLGWSDGPGSGGERSEGRPPDRAGLIARGAAIAGGTDARTLGLWADQFLRLLGDPEVASALSRPRVEPGQTLELWRERRFVVPTGQGLLEGVFDRVWLVRAADGSPLRAHVLDYKTDSLPDEAAAARLTEHYRPQVRAYQSACVRMLGLPGDRVTAELLFLAGPRRVTV